MCRGIYYWRAGESPQWLREGDFGGSRAAIEVGCRIDFSTAIQIHHSGTRLGCPHLRLEAVSPELFPGPRLKSRCLQCLEAAGSAGSSPPGGVTAHHSRHSLSLGLYSLGLPFDGFLSRYFHSPVEVSARGGKYTTLQGTRAILTLHSVLVLTVCEMSEVCVASGGFVPAAVFRPNCVPFRPNYSDPSSDGCTPASQPATSFIPSQQRHSFPAFVSPFVKIPSSPIQPCKLRNNQTFLPQNPHFQAR